MLVTPGVNRLSELYDQLALKLPLRLLQTFAGAFQKKIRTRAVF